MARPYKYNSDQIATAVEEYLVECKEEETAPFFVGLAVKLDTEKEILSRWANYEGDDLDRLAVKSTLKKLKSACEHYLCKATLQGKPVGAIFQLKAGHNYVDRQVVDLRASGDLTVVTGVPAIGTAKDYDAFIAAGKGAEPGS